MTHPIIKTENYLLVVDDGRNYPIDCKYRYIYVDNVITRITSIQPFQNYIDLIIYHLPLNNAPILEGVDLLPPYSRHQEDGLEDAVMEFKERYGSLGVTDYELSAFSKGYNKAKEKYK